MNLDEFAGIKNCDIDIKTGEKLSHREKYQRIINKLGYMAVKRCIPFTFAEVMDMYKRDEHMNFKMNVWDAASGVMVGGAFRREARVVVTPLVSVYRRNGITSFSQSDGVCILKECAIMWIEDSIENEVMK